MHKQSQPTNPRFEDDGTRLEAFVDEILVECPTCGGCCVVKPDPSKKPERYPPYTPRRAVCVGCGFSAEHNARKLSMGGPYDWYFKYPLWLQTICNGEVLWALNRRHLDWLKDYVSATQRVDTKHVNGSIASKLPNWIKGKHERRDVLRCIERLYRKLP
jgi:hypothetical protein